MGLQNPASLPDVEQQADPTMAAPGLATMINAASRGDAGDGSDIRWQASRDLPGRPAQGRAGEAQDGAQATGEENEQMTK